MSQLVGADGPFNTDQWDGYVASRNRLLQSLATNSIDNVVVLTGDIHSSWANEIAVNPFAAATARPQAVEFVGPAVTSPGIDDLAQATALAAQIGTTHPHVKYVDLFRVATWWSTSTATAPKASGTTSALSANAPPMRSSPKPTVP